MAEAHVRAIENPNATGRYVLSSSCGTTDSKDMANWLRNEFKPYGYKGVPNFTAMNFMVKIASVFKTEYKWLLPFLGKDTRCDNKKAVRELGMEFIDNKTCVIDGAYGMIEMGMIKNRLKN